MNSDFNPPMPPLNATPMSAQQARECVEAIRGNLESLRLMLLELYQRRGWEALKYASWEDCAKAEFGKSRAYAFRLLEAASVEANLALLREKSTIVDLDLKDIPSSHLSELAKLPPEKQAEGLLRAEEIAQAMGKKRTAADVAQAVKEILQPEQPESAEHQKAKKAGASTANQLPVLKISLDELAIPKRSEAELKQILSEALQIAKSAKQELNQRFHLETE